MAIDKQLVDVQDKIRNSSSEDMKTDKNKTESTTKSLSKADEYKYNNLENTSTETLNKLSNVQLC